MAFANLPMLVAFQFKRLDLRKLRSIGRQSQLHNTINDKNMYQIQICSLLNSKFSQVRDCFPPQQQ